MLCFVPRGCHFPRPSWHMGLFQYLCSHKFASIFSARKIDIRVDRMNFDNMSSATIWMQGTILVYGTLLFRGYYSFVRHYNLLLKVCLYNTCRQFDVAKYLCGTLLFQDVCSRRHFFSLSEIPFFAHFGLHDLWVTPPSIEITPPRFLWFIKILK